MHNSSWRRPLRFGAVVRSRAFQPLTLSRKRSLLEGFERRQLLSDGSPSPTVCPNCGGGHGFCFSGTDEFRQGNLIASMNDGLIGDSNGLEAQVGARWTSTATNVSTGATGNPITLTWGFVADGVTMPNGGVSGEVTAPSNLQATLNSFYGSNAVWQPLFQGVFDRWSSLAGLTYVFTGYSDDGAIMPQSGVTNGASGQLGVRPDVRIGGKTLNGTSGVLAYNYFPNAGDMTIDTADFGPGGYYPATTASNHLGFRNVLAHEHGHGLGFNHVDPINETKLMEAFVDTTPAFDGPQFDDIYAAQLNYGDPFEKGGRNETFSTASNLGTLGNLANSPVSEWGNANNPTAPRSIANTSDVDFLRFTITSAKNVSFTLSPFGPTYLQGSQGGVTSSFNASAQGNLSFQLIGTNGTTVIQNVNATGLGGSETVVGTNLAAGTYYLRVGSSAGATQPYNVNATISDAAVPVPPAPSVPDLATSSDSGTSTTDNITNDNTPTFAGTAEAGSTVNILFNGVSVGSGVATGGNYAITTTTRPDGTFTVTATATNGSGTGPASPSTSITIDTVAPAAPTANAIVAADDTGSSASDGVTKVANPRFNGGAEPNSTVGVLDGATIVAVTTATAGGAYTTGASTTRPDGTYNYSFLASDVAGNTSGSASLTFRIDTVGPVVTTASFARASSQTVVVNFSEVLGNGIGALTLNNVTLGTSFGTVGGFAGASTDAYSVAGNALTDGRYNAVWSTNTLTDIAGNAGTSTNPILSFNFLRADFNNDSAVNFDDLLILAANYNQTLPQPSNNLGDANYSSTINFDDLLILAATYNTSLPGGPAGLSASGNLGANNSGDSSDRFALGSPPPQRRDDADASAADSAPSSVLN